MKLTAASLTAILASLPTSAYGQCVEPLSECSQKLYRVGIRWEETAKIKHIKWLTCEQKLQTRTSTAISALTEKTPPNPVRWGVLSAIGLGGFAMGVLLALLAR